MEDYLKQQIELIDNKIEENQKLLSDPELALLAQDEIKKLEEEKNQLIQSSTPPSPKPLSEEDSEEALDMRNVILETRGAAGGDEAKNWASELNRMYLHYAQNKGFKTETLEENVLKVKGKNAFGLFKYEAGVHRVQRVPTTESSGRIHTSTATVAILPELEDLDLHIGEEDLKWEFYRSGGHGGQNVNKVSTAVRLIHIPTGLIVTCQTERYQAQNREIALQLLRAKLWEKQEEEKLSKMSQDRRSQIGRGMRSEKIRTYNFPQDRVTDHRIGKSWHNLEGIMEGNLEGVVATLSESFTASPPQE